MSLSVTTPWCENHIFSVKLSGLSLAAEPEGSRGAAARNIPTDLAKNPKSQVVTTTGAAAKAWLLRDDIIEESSKSLLLFYFQEKTWMILWIVIASFHPKNHPSFCKKAMYCFSAFAGPMSCNYFSPNARPKAAPMPPSSETVAETTPVEREEPRWGTLNQQKSAFNVSDHPKGFIQMDATYIPNDTNVFNVFL